MFPGSDNSQRTSIKIYLTIAVQAFPGRSATLQKHSAGSHGKRRAAIDTGRGRNITIFINSITRSNNRSPSSSDTYRTFLTLNTIVCGRNIQYSSPNNDGIVDVYTVFHRSYNCHTAPLPEPDIIVTAYTMFIITGNTQFASSTKNKLSFAEEASFHIFAIGQHIRRTINKCILRPVRRNHKYSLSTLNIDSSSGRIHNIHPVQSQLELIVAIYFK